MIKFRHSSIKSQITIFTIAFTLLITVLLASVSYYIFQHFLKKNLIQSTEFSLQITADEISTHLNELVYFSKWCGSNKYISEYLESNVDNSDEIALEAHERLKEEYQNSNISEYIKRIMISDNEGRFIQIIGRAHDLYISDPYTVAQLDFFSPLLTSSSLLWLGVIDDPLAITKAEQVIPVVRPVYSNYSNKVIGWTYITLSTRVITDKFKNYSIPDDSSIYITINDNIYMVTDEELIKISLDKEIVKLTSNLSDDNLIAIEELEFLGEQRTAISYNSPTKGWTFSQILSKSQLLEQRNWYYLLLFASCLIVLVLGILLIVYLNKIINIPIRTLNNRLKKISRGDFSFDPNIEWENEFGDIGKGINRLSHDVDNLLNKKIADEKQKSELEYQILLNQINPHFLYNTLNSIKWMATMQNATGIAEMTSAFANLLRKVSKETQPIISIEEELSILDDYFLILKYRYGGIINMKHHLESDDLLDCQILRFSLQPLVENSVFHGIEPKGEAGNIKINIYRNRDNILDSNISDNNITIDIIDDGVGMTQSQINKFLSGKGDKSSSLFKQLGISNVNSRIKYTFGEEYGLSISSEVGKYTKIKMIIPYKKLSEEEF